MKKSDLEHIIRAAASITNEYEVTVVGSQSILGSVELPPDSRDSRQKVGCASGAL